MTDKIEKAREALKDLKEQSHGVYMLLQDETITTIKELLTEAANGTGN